MKNFKNWLIAGVIVILIVVGGVYFLKQPSGNSQDSQNTTTTEATNASELTASIEINDGSDTTEYNDISVTEGATVLELTQQVADVETSGEGEMAFVTVLNGRAADSNSNEFWELVINGEPAQVGAGSYIVQDGDSILWRISTF